MEVRVRAGFEEARFEAAEAETSKYVKMDNSQDLKNQKNPRFWRKVKHEVMEIGRVTLNMLKGQGSKFSYLFIPAFISLLWLVICFITTRNPNVTLEEQYIRVRKKNWKKCLKIAQKVSFTFSQKTNFFSIFFSNIQF